MTKAILMPSAEPGARTARLTRWLRREGDFIEAGDPVAEIATARATMDVEAPETGVLSRILVGASDAEIAVESEIAAIEPGPAPHRRAADSLDAHHVARKIASPRARRLARDAGIDLFGLPGRGPQGRVVAADVRAIIERDLALDAEPRAGAPADRLYPKMEAARWTPQVHLEADCRLDALDHLRAQWNEEGRAARKTRISLLDCVVRALALALARVPRANVALTPAGYERARHADVALALALDGEIVAPALTAVEDMSLEAIAAARAAFLAGRFAPDAFVGGVSLVANLGAFGVKRFVPLVVAPWTSVLGIGAAEKCVVVEQGAPAVANVLSVTLSIDRRAMDEVAGGELLAAFKSLMEHPGGLAEG